MARPFKLEIKESAEELAERMRGSRNAQQKERLQMLWWVKTGQVTQHQELGERLGRHDATITRWLYKYRQGGLNALLEIKQAPGKTAMMSAEVQASLKAELAQEHGFRSYGEIVDWLAQEHGLVMEYGTVYDWVHNRWGANLKVPRPQSVKQSPERVMDFKKN